MKALLRRWWMIPVLFAAAFLVSRGWNAASLPVEPPLSNGSPEVTAPAPVVTGRWVLDQGIRRDITLREDGTASLLVELDLISSLVYGSRLQMELSWEQKDNVLTHTIIHGEPAKNVERLARDFGAKRSYRILLLTESEMVLKDVDESDPEEYHWQRPAPQP